MFSSNEEFYQFIDSIIDILHKDGQSDWGLAFENALRAGTMSGEVLGQIRICLTKFNMTDLPRKYKLENKIDESLNSLNKLLGPMR
jgi:hypothetical protein